MTQITASIRHLIITTVLTLWNIISVRFLTFTYVPVNGVVYTKDDEDEDCGGGGKCGCGGSGECDK